jgi:hypothetical protein
MPANPKSINFNVVSREEIFTPRNPKSIFVGKVATPMVTAQQIKQSCF